MSAYIDIDVLKDAECELCEYLKHEPIEECRKTCAHMKFLDEIKSSEDIVKVVRCRDCVYAEDIRHCSEIYCAIHNIRTRKNDFCNYGWVPLQTQNR